MTSPAGSCPDTEQAASVLDVILHDVLRLAISKVRCDASGLTGFPHVTQDGRWNTSEGGRWTGGFFVGMLWLAHFVDPCPGDLTIITRWLERLRPRATDRSTHDLGFLIEPSFVRGFNITGRPELKATAIDAARSLATRFRPQGAFIEAWDDPGYEGVAIIDTIMNLPLLVWAADQAAEPDLRRIAAATAETIRDQHIRSDGSTWHVVRHDRRRGRPISRGTHQGASADSYWTRGQAWAIYGFTRMAVLLDDPTMLTTAEELADSYLERLGLRAIPPWDFERADPDEPRDSAAAAIAASGLLDLWRASGIRSYREAAEAMISGLVEQAIDFEHPETAGLLLHGSVDVPRGSGVDASIIYGDHYFLEALVKLLGPREAWDKLGCVRWS